MLLDIHNKDLSTLLAIYFQEVENLKSMLLEGRSWEEMQQARRNITELAIAIHKNHNYIVHDDIGYLENYNNKKSPGRDVLKADKKEKS